MTSTPGSGAVKKRAWVWSKKTLAEEELKQCTERYRTSWKSAEKRTEVCRRRGLAVMPEQQHKASEHGTGRGRLHAPGQRKRLGHRRGRDDKPLGSRLMKDLGKKTPSRFAKQKDWAHFTDIGSSASLHRCPKREEAHRVAMTSGLGSRTSGEYNSTERNDLHGVWAAGFRKI